MGLLAYRTGGKTGRESRLLGSHWRLLFSGCFSGAAYAVGNGSLDLGRGGNVVCVCLLTTMPQLRGGYGCAQ